MASTEGGGASLPAQGVHDAPDGYQDLARIGQGGFAIVYRALDTRFDRTVALKILRSDSLDEHQLRRFNAECMAIGRVCAHPNIVTVYEAGTTRGHRPWLAMEYCSGGSLAQKVARQGPLPVAEVVSIGARLCFALHTAHEAGILHRDVKPHNVLLTSYGEPALADFGIASVVIEDDTLTETAAYTVVHAAPEILEGSAGTAAADIYSLASTLYTLLAGQAPFAKEAGTGLAPLVARILRNDLPVIARPGVPPELEQLLRRCLAARPQDRPSAAEFGDCLARLGNQLDVALAHLGQELAAQEIARQEQQGVLGQVTQGAGPHPPAAVTGSVVAPPGPAPISGARLLLALGGALAILLAAFTTWDLTHRGDGGDQRSPTPVALKATRADARYNPANVVVTQGKNRGELIVTWQMPIRPDVVATVISQGTGTTKARAVVGYNRPRSVPAATLHGLPRRQQVCLSVVHVVSLDDKITNAAARPVCAVPR